jgi:hypothetical protein
MGIPVLGGEQTFGEACSEKISQSFMGMPLSRHFNITKMSTKGIALDFNIKKGNITHIGSKIVAGYPNLNLRKGTLEAAVLSSNGEILNQFNLSDPRITMSDEVVTDSQGIQHLSGREIYRDDMNFTLVIPFYDNAKTLTITNSTTRKRMIALDITNIAES